MYERFYNLRERPFSLSPDPDYLYPSRVHQEALSYLRYGIEGHAGFIIITGEIGSGKTTLLQAALRGLDRDRKSTRLNSSHRTISYAVFCLKKKKKKKNNNQKQKK